MKIGGRRYVDGGVCSVSNMDLVAGRGLDLVICLNPLTSSSEGQGSSRGGITGVATGAVNDVLDLIPSITRRASRRRLEREERKVRRFGTEVVIIEPTAEDHAVMGHNWMSAERRQDVIDTAEETVAKQLRDPAIRKLLARPARRASRTRSAARPGRRRHGPSSGRLSDARHETRALSTSTAHGSTNGGAPGDAPSAPGLARPDGRSR